MPAGDGDVLAGDVPLSALQTQIQVLNSAYAGSPFTFVLAGVDRHTNVSVRLSLPRLLVIPADMWDIVCIVCGCWYCVLHVPSPPHPC